MTWVRILRFNPGRSDIGRALPILLSFIIIHYCLYIVNQDSVVQGYEISIYDEYPTHFWYLIIISIFLCQISLFLNVSSGEATSTSWKAACIGIVISNSILILIPLIRRYAIYGLGDPSSHMGLMRDMLHTGQIGSNMYPAVHIIGVVSHLICGLSLNYIMLLYPLIFYIFFVLSVYLLFKVVLNCEKSILIGMMLALLLFGGYSSNNIAFFPQGLSNYYIVFALYLFFSRYTSTKPTYNTILIIIIFFITFFHPLTALILISIFLIYDVSHHICSPLHCTILNSGENKINSINLILIQIIILFIWQSYARVLLGTVRRVYSWLYGDIIGSSMLDLYGEKLTEIEPDLYFLFISFLYKYGLWLTYILFGIICISIIFKDRKENNCLNDIYYIVFSAAVIIYFIIYLIGQFTINGTGFGRLGHFAVLFSILITSRAFGYMLTQSHRQKHAFKLLSILLIFGLFCITFLSVFTLYMSPITNTYGQHVSDSILTGMDTFFEIRSDELQILEGKIRTYRIKDALYGESKQLSNVRRSPTTIPSHFNYTTSSYFGDNYNTHVYAVINTLFRMGDSRIIPEYPEKWRFNQTDFFLLENDISVSKVYSNQELDIYLTKPTVGNLPVVPH